MMFALKICITIGGNCSDHIDAIDFPSFTPFFGDVEPVEINERSIHMTSARVILGPLICVIDACLQVAMPWLPKLTRLSIGDIKKGWFIQLASGILRTIYPIRYVVPKKLNDRTLMGRFLTSNIVVLTRIRF